MLLGEGLCLWPWKALGLPVSPLVLLHLQIHLFSSLHPGCQLYCKFLHLLGFLLPYHSMPHYLLPFLHLIEGGVGGLGGGTEVRGR